MTKKPYTGVLLEETPSPFGRAPLGAEWGVILGLRLRKLIALLDHYNIPGGLNDSENGWTLALCLADDHIPGFGMTYRPRPKPKHRPHDLLVGGRDLILCMELLRVELEGGSVRQASRELAERWRREGKCNWKAESLRRRYMLLRKSGELTEGMKDAARVLRGGT